jgi:hypothetical protein
LVTRCRVVRQQQEGEASEAWLRSDRRVPRRKKLRDVKESDCSLAQSQLFTCLKLLRGDSTDTSLGYLKNGLHALKPKIQTKFCSKNYSTKGLRLSHYEITEISHVKQAQ